MGYPEEKKVEFSAEHQPARRGRTPKRVKYAGQFAEFDDRAAGMFGLALDTYQAILDGTFRQPMMNNKTGVVEEVGPTADQSLKAADAIANRVLGKAASHKEVEVNIERQDTMVILTGDAASELRALRRRNKELEERVLQLPAAMDAEYREGEALLLEPRATSPLAYPSPVNLPLTPSASSPAAASPVSAAPAVPSLADSAFHLPPTDASLPAFSSVPATERTVERSRAKAEGGS